MSPLAEGWNDTVRLYAEALDGCRLHEALGELWEFVGGANRVVDAEKPWDLAKAWKAGDEAAAIDFEACSAISSRRAGWSVSRPRRSCPARRRACWPSSATGTATARTATVGRRSWVSWNGVRGGGLRPAG